MDEVFVVFILGVAGLLGGSYALFSYDCHSYQEVTGRPTKTAGGVCYVQDNGQWFSRNEYIARSTTLGTKE